MKRIFTLLLFVFIYSIQSYSQCAGKALQFDGVNDYVNCGSASSLAITGNTLTLEAWVNPTSNGAFRIIMNREGEFECALDNGVFSFALANSTPGWAWVNSGTSIPLNTWTHIALVYDGSTAKVYKDGILTFTGSANGNLGDAHTQWNEFWIGSRQGIADSRFNGSIDEVRVWSAALNQTNVQQWKNKTLDASHPSYSNLKGYWKLDEGTGTTANDASANGNNGTLTNGPVWVNSDVNLGYAPVINSLSPLSGPVGTSVTITGSNFDPIPANNSVYIGNIKVAATAASSTSLTFNVPAGITNQPVTVTNNCGLTAVSKQSFSTTFSCSATINTATMDAAQLFTTMQQYTYSSTAGDLDGDGKPEMIAVSHYGAINIYRNTATAGVINASTFAAPITLLDGTLSGIRLADMDGDGKQDMVAIGNGNGNVLIYRNTGSPGTISFASPVTVSTGTNGKDVAITDIDLDGKPDLACAPNYYGGPVGNLTLIKNNSTTGTLSFASYVNLTAPPMPNSYYFTRIDAGDIDGDGFPELVLSTYTYQSVYVYKNNGVQGSISAASYAAYNTIVTGNYTLSSKIADLDSDGKPELIAGGYNGLSVLKNTSTPGSMSFAPKVDFAIGSSIYDLQIADMNGDGKPDLVFYNSGLWMMQNNSATGIINSSSLANPVDGFALVYGGGTYYTGMQTITVADADGDSQPDAIVTGYNMNGTNSFISVFRNKTGSPALQTITANGPTTFCTGGSVTLSVPNVAGVSYQWKHNGANTGSNSNTLSASQGGTYKVEISNSCGVTVSNGINITVETAAPNVQTISPAGPVSLCLLNSTTLSVPSQTGVSYQWKSNGVNIGSNSNSFTANATGSYTLNMTNTCGTTATANTVSITATSPDISSVLPLSASPGSAVVITGNNFDPVAANNKVYFGAVKAVVNSATATSLNVTVPPGATHDFVTVVNACNYIAYSRQKFTPSFGCGGSVNTAFSTPTTFTASSPFSLRAINTADMDGDGKPDVLLSDYNYNSSPGGKISIYRNTASSGVIDNNSLASPVNISVAPNSSGTFKTGDLNNDGKPDLVVANYANPNLSVFRNTSSVGTISLSLFNNLTTDYNPNGFTLNDFDGDGRTDIIVSYSTRTFISIFRNTSTSSSLSFASRVDIYVGVSFIDMADGDIDGDGKPDIILSGGGSLYVFRNTSTPGSILFAAPVAIGSSIAGGMQLADIDNDGKLDAVSTNSTNQGVVLKNTSSSGTITFAPAVLFAVGSGNGFYRGIGVGDINGDGKLDLAYPNFNLTTASIIANNSMSSPSLSAVATVTVSGNPAGTILSDIDLDGKPDLVTVGYDASSFSIYRNNSILANATVTPAGTVSICPGGSATLTASAGVSWLWSNGETTQAIQANQAGSYSVTVTDANGCTSSSTPVLVSLYPATPAPEITPGGPLTFCPGSSVTLTAASGNSWLWSTGATTQSISVNQSGNYTVTVTDANNCPSISPAMAVSVTDDIAPVPNNATLPTIIGQCSATVTAPTAMDDCAGTITASTSDPLSYTAQGTYTVHWVYNDGNGNTSTQTQTVVVDDDMAPVPDNAALPTITGQCSATVTAPTAMDDCAGAITASTSDPLSYTAQGTYTVHWVYNDGNGNTSTQTQTVVVDDDMAPVPDNATLPTITGQCSATVIAPTATDNCAGTITASTSDPLSYTAQGTYTVHWIYNDGNGNTSTQTQTVVVDDDMAPVPDNAALPTITGQCSATVTAPTAMDDCAGTITASTSDPLSYTAQGTYTVHWVYNDGNGNTSTQTQTVVVDDDMAPVPDNAALPTITGQCSATVTAPTATDNCAGAITASTTDALSYTAQGTYTVHWVYNDGNGNTSTQTQTVVVDDDIAPVPDNATLPTITGQCSATVIAPTATDNCAGTITASTSDPLSYTAQGTYTVHWIYNDGNGNTSTQTQTVVINDVTSPWFTSCQGNIVLPACTSTASWAVPVAADNCTGVTSTRTAGPAPNSTFACGTTTTITYTATDAAGHTATCSFTVTRAAALSASASATPIFCNGGTSTVTVSATGGTAPYTGTGTFTRSAGVHNFTVTDADGCTVTTSVNITEPAALAAACSTNNAVLYYGYSGDQSAVITVKPSGGVGPYSVSITMNRPLRCNVVTSSGDEIWTPGANTAGSSNISCPTSGSATLLPVSSSTNAINSVTGYSINVTLMQDATFTATITDANGCTTTRSISIHAEDVRCFAGNSGNSKITICHQTGSTSKPCVKICVDETALADHLSHGDFIGACTQNCTDPNNGLSMLSVAEAEIVNDLLKVKVWPVPTETEFTLSTETQSKEEILVRVFDINGRQVYWSKGPATKQYRFGEMFVSGIYLVEVRQGKQKSVMKIIKQ